MIVWYTARAAGLSALILLTVATALGAVVSARRPTARRLATRTVLQYVHRAAAGAGLAVLVLHVVTILADSYAHVGVTGAIVPFTASYRATAVGLGTLGGYLLIAAAVVGMLRTRFAASPRGVRTWRRLHSAGYAAWALAVVHGLTAGTDAGTLPVRLLLLGCVLAVGGALVYRLTADRRVDLLRPRAGSTPPVPEPHLTGALR